MSQRQHPAQVGERWAYRASSKDLLVEVEILRVGTAKPARVLVAFVDDQFEGKEQWVPPARLKVLWSGVEAFQVSEARWAAVSVTDVRDTPEELAASWIFGELIDFDLADLEHGTKTEGVTRIRDVDRLAEHVGVAPDDLRDDPTCFPEDGDLIVPWRITEMVSRRVAERHPDRVLRYVDQEEAKAQRRMIHGKFLEGTDYFITPERCAESEDEHYARPYRETLRRWCGAEAIERHDELQELRREVRRIGGLVADAIGELRRAGSTSSANRLEKELGVTVEELRKAARYDSSGG